jgi:hypothetical protein
MRLELKMFNEKKERMNFFTRPPYGGLEKVGEAHILSSVRHTLRQTREPILAGNSHEIFVATE